MILRLVGPVHRDQPMQPLEHGYHVAEAHDVHPGQRYLFRLEDGPDRPDPASFSQPDGVHSPSAVVDPRWEWHDAGWRGLPLADLVLYELHVGTFTPEGTFAGVASQLDRLRDLGVNAIELMPIAQFPGWRNWGYDGVYPFAVQHSYGGTHGLKHLVEAAHQRGMAVLLDVVYNHLGPEGNYFRSFGPYFTDHYRTPWGEPINFDGPGCDGVRDAFVANALRWQEEFHLDGLRLDAVPFIKDFSARHILAEIAARCAEKAQALGRPFHLIGESDLNDPRVIRPRELGGHGLAAQWSDDFHHAVHAFVTGERSGYYADHGGVEQIARACRDAFVLTGQYSHFRKRRYGAPASDRPGEQFVICVQNHDQVGNRVHGDRLAAQVDDETLKVLAGLLLTVPYLPMLFMGEEYGERAPFPFFISHSDGGLIDRVRRGRKQEFANFSWHGEPPDPQDETTFRRAHLQVDQASHGRGKMLHDWHRTLIRMRREHPALRRLDRRNMTVAESESPPRLVLHRWAGTEATLAIFHLGEKPGRIEATVPAGRWRLLLDSASSDWQGPGSTAPPVLTEGTHAFELPARCMLLYTREPSAGP